METATIDIRTADGNVNILLEDKQIAALTTVLTDLVGATKAVFSLLIDAAGKVVAQGGATQGFSLEGIAALAAADLATTRQLASMLNEPEFALLFQHEKQKNMLMTAIESDAILIVVFDVDTTFGALRLRIRRSISQLQTVLNQAKRSTVVALSSAAAVTGPVGTDDTAGEVTATIPVAPSAPPPKPAAARIEAVPEPAAPAAGPERVEGRPPEPVEGPPPAPAGWPANLTAELGKALAWFENFKGWKLAYKDEIAVLQRALDRQKPEEAEAARAAFVRVRARLTEQKRLLEARFRMIQSLYQQFVLSLQVTMQGAWRDEVVDRAMKAAFHGVGAENNLVGGGIQKKDGNWMLDFGVIGKQLVVVCDERNWDYRQGLREMLHQLNAGMSALSVFVIGDPRMRDDLMKSWAKLFHHYADGLKTLELEPDVLDLFRPILHSQQPEGK